MQTDSLRVKSRRAAKIPPCAAGFHRPNCIGLMRDDEALIHYFVDQLGDSLCPFMVS
jgi:hypothetical protein